MMDTPTIIQRLLEERDITSWRGGTCLTVHHPAGNSNILLISAFDGIDIVIDTRYVEEDWDGDAGGNQHHHILDQVRFDLNDPDSLTAIIGFVTKWVAKQPVTPETWMKQQCPTSPT